MKDLIEFLQARIAEDEKVAIAASDAGQQWSTMTEETSDGENIYYTVEVPGKMDSTIADMASTSQTGRNQSEHIVRHDPARVLAECHAKRAIIAGRERIDHSANDDEWSMGYSDANYEALHALAAVYKDHRDYRKEWAAV